MDSFQRLWEWLPETLLIAAITALWRWLKPRRLLSFLTAVKEREAALATAVYWEAEANRERASGLRWEAHYNQCLKEMETITKRRGFGSEPPTESGPSS
jgi:hypothetical protein